MATPAGGYTPIDMLATAADLQAMPGVTLTTDEATLLIQLGTAVVQSVCGQRIVQVVDDQVVLDLDEYDGGPWLFLPERPVTAVSAVAIGATALATLTDYTVQLSRGRLWRATGWRSTLLAYCDQPSTVTVVNTHGWPAGHQRLQLGRAATLGLAKPFAVNPKGAARITIDDYTEAYDAMTAKMEASPFLADRLRAQYAKPPGSVRLVRS